MRNRYGNEVAKFMKKLSAIIKVRPDGEQKLI